MSSRTAVLLVGLLVVAAHGAEPGNLLPNPSLELVEPPLPTDTSVAPRERWVPRTWDVSADGGAVFTCPDDPAQAHSGRRSARFTVPRGGGALRYGPVPAAVAGPWTVRFWGRGQGRIAVGGFEVRPDRWERLPLFATRELTSTWQVYECVVAALPGGCRRWILELATQGTGDLWLDDLHLSCPGSAALGLPPDQPMTRDAATLLLLPFETPLDEDAYFLKGAVRLSAPEEGRFGRGLLLGPEAYVACSANENLDPAAGTIELWARFDSPGNDSLFRNLVGVPGPEGMSLHKDQYSHVAFGFSSGWAPLSYVQAQGHAWRWQPGVWRHFAACWDAQLLQLFVDGKLLGWRHQPRLSRWLGPELRLGSPGMALDDLRISKVVRYRQDVPPGKE